MSTETAPTKAAPKKDEKPQSAVQVPDYADKLAGSLAMKLDDSKKHVYGAAILGFAALDPVTQVALMQKSRVSFRESAG